MQETEECPVNKKRATWETILDGKVGAGGGGRRRGSSLGVSA